MILTMLMVDGSAWVTEVKGVGEYLGVMGAKSVPGVIVPCARARGGRRVQDERLLHGGCVTLPGSPVQRRPLRGAWGRERGTRGTEIESARLRVTLC